MNTLHRLLGCARTFGLGFWLTGTLLLATAPTVSFVSTPSTAADGTIIKPVAVSVKGSANLTSVVLYYSWDGVTYYSYVTNNSPDNSNPDGDFTGEKFELLQTGTLRLRAIATDASSQTGQANITVTVTSASSSAPSWLWNQNATYNYGATWMYDSAEDVEKVWWTVGASGGDHIYNVNLTTHVVTDALPLNSYNDHLHSDPSVIKYNYSNGYNYGMYYTEGQPNGVSRIAQTFSYDGLSWITPTQDVVLTQDANMTSGYYGAGFPSVIRVVNGGNSTFCMFNFDYNTAGGGAPECYFRTSSDGISWTQRSANTSVVVPVSLSGLAGTVINGRFSYYSGYWYFVYTYSSTAPAKVYKIQAHSTTLAPTGSWTLVGTVTSPDAIYSLAAPGFLRDENGCLPAGLLQTYYDATLSGQNSDLASQLWWGRP